MMEVNFKVRTLGFCGEDYKVAMASERSSGSENDY